MVQIGPIWINTSAGIYLDCTNANLLRSDLKVPPYFGLLPIRSIISGMQEAKTAWKCAWWHS